jgi:hypothetical protein
MVFKGTMPMAIVANTVSTQIAQSVHTGFAATMMSAASLFGLVLIALSFGYRAAMDRIENIGDFRHFGAWMWSSGLTCCVYYAYCLLIPAHLMVTNYSQTRLIVWIITCCVFILVGHAIETRSLFRMGREDWDAFHLVFTVQTTTVVIIFASFLTLNLYAVSSSSQISMFDELLVSLAFTLVLVSIRAVLLIATSFYAITLLYTYEQEQKACEFCGKRVPQQAVKCPYCHSTL